MAALLFRFPAGFLRNATRCTNNMVEYEACIMGLEEAIDLRTKYLDVYGDSALVVNHI